MGTCGGPDPGSLGGAGIEPRIDPIGRPIGLELTRDLSAVRDPVSVQLWPGRPVFRIEHSATFQPRAGGQLFPVRHPAVLAGTVESILGADAHSVFPVRNSRRRQLVGAQGGIDPDVRTDLILGPSRPDAARIGPHFDRIPGEGRGLTAFLIVSLGWHHPGPFTAAPLYAVRSVRWGSGPRSPLGTNQLCPAVHLERS